MPDIPGDARELAGAISDAGCKVGERIAHASLPGTSRATIPAYSIQEEQAGPLAIAGAVADIKEPPDSPRCCTAADYVKSKRWAS